MLRWIPLILMAFASAAPAQTPLAPNERAAPRRINPEDKDDIWVLGFKYKPPRIITVDIPGRGPTTVWYLWYQVYNETGSPRFFYPTFDLVTLDRNTSHVDEVLPSVQAAIARKEDPTGYLNIQNSVTISEKPIPPTKPDALPVLITGVAIWPDVATRAGDTTQFSIFVGGLSNGWAVDSANTIRRKTLQLNFRRYADAAHQDSQDIRFVAPEEWLYRSTSVPAPKLPG